MKNKLILIGGGTAAGKTLISKLILKKLNYNASIIKIDNYYKDIDDIDDIDEHINWDKPNKILWNDLYDDIDKLLNNKKIERKKYNFKNSSYSKDEIIVTEPNEFIIVEGLFALIDEKLLKKAYTTIYVTSSIDLRLKRRINRDVVKKRKEINITDFLEKWEEEIHPMHLKYITGTKENAKIIINNESNLFHLDKENLLKKSSFTLNDENDENSINLLNKIK